MTRNEFLCSLSEGTVLYIHDAQKGKVDRCVVDDAGIRILDSTPLSATSCIHVPAGSVVCRTTDGLRTLEQDASNLHEFIFDKGQSLFE